MIVFWSLGHVTVQARALCDAFPAQAAPYPEKMLMYGKEASNRKQ